MKRRSHAGKTLGNEPSGGVKTTLAEAGKLIQTARGRDPMSDDTAPTTGVTEAGERWEKVSPLGDPWIVLPAMTDRAPLTLADLDQMRAALGGETVEQAYERGRQDERADVEFELRRRAVTAPRNGSEFFDAARDAINRCDHVSRVPDSKFRGGHVSSGAGA